MLPNGLETGLRDEMLGLNLEFLKLATRRDPGAPALGLAPAIRARLAGLDRSALRKLAQAPGLLASFAGNPAEPEPVGVADGSRAFPAVAVDGATVVYTTSLLTWLWQLSRHLPVQAALFGGVGVPLTQWLGVTGVGELQRRSPRAARLLVARFADHPRFWPDLLTALEGADAEALALAQLSMLQLGLMDQGPSPAIAMRPGACTMPSHAGPLDP